MGIGLVNESLKRPVDLQNEHLWNTHYVSRAINVISDKYGYQLIICLGVTISTIHFLTWNINTYIPVTSCAH